MRKLWNAIGFQAGWWVCILSVSRAIEPEALLFCMALIGAHVYASQAPRQELQLTLAAVLIGVLLDSALQYFQVIDFAGQSLLALSPYWLWALWGVLATTLNASLAFLQRLPRLLIAGLGFFLGPWTYYAGAQLGAARFETTPFHVLTLAVAWAMVLPVLVALAQRKTDHAN